MSNLAGGQDDGNSEINQIMERAAVFASDNRHEYITTEHMLWSLLHDKNLSTILTDIGGQPNHIRNETEKYQRYQTFL